ncbi:MAG: hypothetical protein IJ515_03790 [Clostridia bacterium]|nr:hypothetical protein [Clostridia bacterium]
MGFQIPEYLKRYIEQTKYRKPFENFVNNSTYYSQLNWQWINYMNNVVRPCIAYSTGSTDNSYNTSLSMSTGMAICKAFSRLIIGDRVLFAGNDESCKFLSDIWAPSMNFNKFLHRTTSFMAMGGTAVIKSNRDAQGRNYLTAFRIDRTLISVNDNGDITNAVFFVGLLTSLKNDSNQSTYWLVEERKYNDDGEKVIIYKVFVRAGIASSPTLPSPFQMGVNFDNLPKSVQRELKSKGITELNTEIPLPTRDGLGVWTAERTATNSCVPDAPLGDPLLYGCLDLLWSIDVVFSGSIVDVLNGEGKILVPKQFLQDTLNRIQQQYPTAQFNVTTAELKGYGDESFVYIMPSGVDRDKMTPVPVQFEIRADQYGKMMEIYERAACVRAGFSPTSIFPYLTPDNSAKTATEVTAEENLTRASVRDVHAIFVPVINRALREILYQEGFNTDVQIQLSDYIGNKLQHDSNVRDNVAAGLTPREVGVKQINNLNESETAEYMEKISKDLEMQDYAPPFPPESDFEGGDLTNENIEQTAQYPGADIRGGAGENPSSR